LENSIFKKDWHDKVILIVEDNLSCYRYFEEILKRTGVTIVHLETGPDAIDYCCYTDKQIDLALVDILIPFINGVEVIREIRKCRHGVPIIAETAYSSPDVRRKSFMAGCHEYLVKPIPPQVLIATLEHYLFPEGKVVRMQFC